MPQKPPLLLLMSLANMHIGPISFFLSPSSLSPSVRIGRCCNHSSSVAVSLVGIRRVSKPQPAVDLVDQVKSGHQIRFCSIIKFFHLQSIISFDRIRIFYQFRSLIIDSIWFKFIVVVFVGKLDGSCCALTVDVPE